MIKANLKFYGGTGEVTGSNFLLSFQDETYMIDCGLFQGCPTCGDKNAAPFPYNPAEVGIVFITHAHLDHIGRLPKLVKEGFSGVIYSTPPTKDIAEAVFEDALHIMEEEHKKTGRTVLYAKDDVAKTFSLWKTVPYRTPMSMNGEKSVKFLEAGHILGSAMVEFTALDSKIVFTGDLGNSPSPLLPDTDEITDARYLVIESVYGDRNHETRDERRDKLEDSIEETARNSGVLMVPAFSIERTQEILYEIERMVENHKIPRMPVYLDSPLAIKVTDIYRKYSQYLNKKVKRNTGSDNDIFAFPGLVFTETVEASKKIFETERPKIIIAGSGMSEGGRIVHHEKRYLPHSENTLLLVGYQAPGTLGREIEDGAKLVNILGEEVPVNARVLSIRGYSSHKDSEHLLSFAVQTADTLKKAFVVMGEPKAAAFLTQRLRDYVGIDAVAPQIGETFELEF